VHDATLGSMKRINIGIAGWSNPPAQRAHRRAAQSHLMYYSEHFSCVEINSSFHRAHAIGTYERWRDATHRQFKFSVKMPRAITHEYCLRGAAREVSRFYKEIEGLQPKLGAVLVQLPSSVEFNARLVRSFFKALPRFPDTEVVCEPRHPSWFSAEADAELRRSAVSRVAADPPRADTANLPGGDRSVAYFRWHGSPIVYQSSYSDAQLNHFAATVRGVTASEVWCVFDNTARCAAWENALKLQIALNRSGPEPVRRKYPTAPETSARRIPASGSRTKRHRECL
jgi:uncharacterized protein YecE (DUF72 family)